MSWRSCLCDAPKAALVVSMFASAQWYEHRAGMSARSWPPTFCGASSVNNFLRPRHCFSMARCDLKKCRFKKTSKTWDRVSKCSRGLLLPPPESSEKHQASRFRTRSGTENRATYSSFSISMNLANSIMMTWFQSDNVMAAALKFSPRSQWSIATSVRRCHSLAAECSLLSNRVAFYTY